MASGLKLMKVRPTQPQPIANRRNGTKAHRQRGHRRTEQQAEGGIERPPPPAGWLGRTESTAKQQAAQDCATLHQRPSPAQTPARQARRVAADLRMHRTSVDHAGLRPRRSVQIARRIGAKFRLTARTAEEVSYAIMFSAVLCRRRIDGHAVDGIERGIDRIAAH
jgi:hypothetical protein